MSERQRAHRQVQRDMCLMRARSEASTRMSMRQQPWSDAQTEHGRILVLSDNPISQAIASIASAAGRDVLVEAADDGGPGLEPRATDAVVICDHDAPDAPRVLRAALASEA